MSELEKGLGLIKLSLAERAMEDPAAWRLKQVPKLEQTTELLMKVCSCDGLALRYAAKKLITPKLCEVAVNENVMAIAYVPLKVFEMSEKYQPEKRWAQQLCEKAIKKNGMALAYVPPFLYETAGTEWARNICEIAVKDNGRALEFVPNELKTMAMIEQAVSHFRAPGDGYNDLEKQHGEIKLRGNLKYPVAFVPYKMLTPEVLEKAVSHAPDCIRDVHPKKITEDLVNLAITKNPLALEFVRKQHINQNIVDKAISANPMAVRYVPKEFLTHEMCEDCFSRDYAVLPYLGIEYISKEMCMKILEINRFSLYKMTSEEKQERFGDSNISLVLFEDFPETMRNDKTILDTIIKKYKYRAYPLLKWDEDVRKRINEARVGAYVPFVPHNQRNEEIIPLKDKTVRYLKKNSITPIMENTVGEAMVPTELPVFTREIIKQSELICSDEVLKESALISDGYKIKTYDFSEDDKSKRWIYYITDIHLEHQLPEEFYEKRATLPSAQSYAWFDEWLNKKIDHMISFSNNKSGILMIGGDVANSIEFEKEFYKRLFSKWSGRIVSILGNHELWDGTTLNDWCNPDYKARSVEEIVAAYKNSIKEISLPLRAQCTVLENEIYVLYKNESYRTISENLFMETSDADLKDLFSKCSLIVIGGIGFSGREPIYNAEMGLYRKTITTLNEDRRRSDRFYLVYQKLLRCARDKSVVVLTHTPVQGWMEKEDFNPNWIYINGHTHHNSVQIRSDGTKLLHDNQVGYKPSDWKLNAISLNGWYDPFEMWQDGIYKITSEQYGDFNQGRDIMCDRCPYEGDLFLLKRDGLYMFVIKTKTSLCLMEGGRRKRLGNPDVNYYYENLGRYGRIIKRMIKPYQEVMQKLSADIQKMGGDGSVHGCIVDISFFSHVYVNPYDGKITPYWAMDTVRRQPFDNIRDLLEQKEPQLMDQYASVVNELQLLGKSISDGELRVEEDKLPAKWVYGTEMYDPSRIMKSVQYVWEQNVIRIWRDEILNLDG